MKKFYKLTVFSVALVVAMAGLIPAVAYSNTAKQNIDGIIEYNLQKSFANSVQEWIDGELTYDAGEGSEWYIIALSNQAGYDFSSYKNALNDYLSKNEIGSASSRLKYALTYIAIGDKSNPYIKNVLGNSIGEQGIMSLVFGLHLLNNGCVCDDFTVNTLVDELLSLQLADGGWSVMGEYGDVDVTAMTVQALAVHYNNPAVKTSVDNAVDFLSVHQLENGGYSGYGVANPESTAQVVTALSSLGIDADSDERFIKNGNTVFDGMSTFRLSDGSFCHKEGGNSDSMSMAQVLSASIAYENMKNGYCPFYIFDDNNMNYHETATDELITEATLNSEVIDTVFYNEGTAEITSTPINYETDIHKTELSGTDDIKTNSAYLKVFFGGTLLISVCVVFMAVRKRKKSSIYKNNQRS